jgi:hypothetical protein
MGLRVEMGEIQNFGKTILALPFTDLLEGILTHYDQHEQLLIINLLQ